MNIFDLQPLEDYLHYQGLKSFKGWPCLNYDLTEKKTKSPVKLLFIHVKSKFGEQTIKNKEK